MIIGDELQKLKLDTFQFTKEEWEAYYQDIYDMLYFGDETFESHLMFACESAINMYRLRQAGYVEQKP